MRKYELTSELKVVDGIKLFRIRALISFDNVKAGDLGGYVEKECNLSHEGNAWISDNAVVRGNALVCDNSYVCNNACVRGNALVCDNSYVSGNAHVSGNAEIRNNAFVGDNVRVHGNAEICGNAHVSGNSRIYGNACLRDNVRVHGNARISRNAYITEDSCVCGNAHIHGNVHVRENAYICGDAVVCSSADYATIRGFGSKYRNTTFFRQKDKSIGVSCGCFYGTLPEFREKVKETHRNTKYAKEYLMIADLMEMHFAESEDK